MKESNQRQGAVTKQIRFLINNTISFFSIYNFFFDVKQFLSSLMLKLRRRGDVRKLLPTVTAL